MAWNFLPDAEPGSLLAAFAGAVSAAILFKTRSLGQLVSIVVVGFLTAIYFGPLVTDGLIRLGFHDVPGDGLANASGFFCGLTGMVIGNGLIALVRRRLAREDGK